MQGGQGASFVFAIYFCSRLHVTQLYLLKADLLGLDSLSCYASSPVVGLNIEGPEAPLLQLLQCAQHLPGVWLVSTFISD